MSGSLPRIDAREVAVVAVDPGDPRAAVLLQDLEREYDARYRDLMQEAASTELSRYPSSRFLPPEGAFLLLEHRGAVIGGGALMRFDQDTAEFKRIWTHPEHRRRGVSRIVLAALETEAMRLGYRRVHLTTGPRQPEAQALYASSGYTVLPLIPVFADFAAHPFEKALPPAPEQRSGTAGA